MSSKSSLYKIFQLKKGEKMKQILLIPILTLFVSCGGNQPNIAQIQAQKERQAKIQAQKERQAQIQAQKEKRAISLNENFSKKRENALISYLDTNRPNLSISYSKKPFAKVSQQTQKYFNIFQITKIPKEISTPKLPEVENLEKGRFEKTVEFRQRVQMALDKREAELFRIQKKYREDVENRNRVVQILSSVNSKAETLNSSFKNRAVEWAISDVMGNFEVSPKDYDADRELLLATVSATNSNYKKDITFKVSPQKAEKIWQNPKSVLANIDFKISGSQISVRDIKVDGVSANLGGEFQKVEKVEFAIRNTNKDFSSKQFSLQSANLKDYRVDRTQFIETKFLDDLPSLLAKTPKAKIDDRKWAFVVGVEEYKDADVVPFSKRSAEMFGKVLTHSLGVKKRNIYSLIGRDASTTAIKDSMRKMLQNVKSGDTIYFYYSGHGVPSNDGKAYILPQDKFVDFVHEDKKLQLDQIYLDLTGSKAQKVVAFVDSCFSGKTGAENDETLFKGKGTAGIYARDIKTEFDKDRMAVLTAGSNTQFSNMFEDKGHRLFSYFLMKAILEGKKSLDSIFSTVKVNVDDTSNGMGDRYRQTPQIDGNSKLDL
jgi:hypothetical protein